MKRYDAIILGAGPAGTSTAIAAAIAGMKVLLVEARQFPRSRPGESLHPGVEPLFKKLGVLDAILAKDYARPTGFYRKQKQETAFIPYSPDDKESWNGWLIGRDEMDIIFLDEAKRKGVEVRENVASTSLIYNNGCIEGISCHSEKLYANYTVDATGHNFWLTRQLKSTIHQQSKERFAYWGVSGGHCENELLRSNPFFCVNPDGWTWIAPIRPQVFQWTYMPRSFTKLDEGWQPLELMGTKPIGKFQAQEVTNRIVDIPSGPGYFCVGDAAFVIDPAASHGVLKGIMSGIMAAHLISGVCQGKNITSEEAGLYYSEWITSWFKNDCKKLEEFYENY